jgi:excisionase family DNA binding protein
LKNNVIQFPADGSRPRDLASTIENRRKAMTVKEVADVLGVSDKQIYSLASRNLIPYFRVGGALRFDPFAIAAWLRKQQAAA